MSSQIDPVQLPSPARVGQATAVEQTRAAAQVLAAVRIAQEYPRAIQVAIAEMRESCAQMRLAEKSFFRFPRGGQNVSGASVYLARELARCWRNVDYGIAEMARDDDLGQSEMIAFAWDLEANTRNSSTFFSPHKRDTKDGVKALDDLRSVYENNANQGARRVRECIFAILPPWFVDEAKELCAKTLREGGGVPLAQRIADTIRAFEGGGVTKDRMEAKLNRKADRWTEHDIAQFRIVFASIGRGEVRIEDEFPEERVDASEIAGARPVTVPPVPPSADAEAAEEAGWPATAPIPGGE